MDILVASIVLILFSPIILLSLLIQWIEIGSSPVFIQTRPGKNEVPFNIIKLKTMNEKRDSKGNLLPDKDRITRFGRFFRSASIDELPQLINVLKGDMSFVGPRPLLVEYLSHYNEEQRKRHDVRPGITGLAQVNGRNTISWPDKFKYDLTYVMNISFILDLKILLLTLIKVFKRNDIQANEEVTMPKFKG
jgi:undecaprenyl phosphate N,N'-diacetylbacillosamine 1-phosphate transferase